MTMKINTIIIFGIVALLLLGCTAPKKNTPKEEVSEQTIDLPGDILGQDECVPSYKFSTLPDTLFSINGKLNATLNCAGGKTLKGYLDGKEIWIDSIGINGSINIIWDIPATTEGNHKVEVKSDEETVYLAPWKVSPLGNNDTSSIEIDSISFKEWRATAFDLGSTLNGVLVKAYMKRLDDNILPSSVIVMEIRDDDNGPGKLIAESKKPINATTLSDNWIKFPFNATLQKGKYWIVIKVEQNSKNLAGDVVALHYSVIDREEQGNNYTRQMHLDVDLKTVIASQTKWEPLPYDKEYSIVITN